MPDIDHNQRFDATGQILSSVEVVVSDEQLRRRGTTIRLQNAITVLRQWKTDAEVVAAQGTNVTQAQTKALFGRFGTLCDNLADLLEIRVSGRPPLHR